jgi:2'-5' RNA ligase
VRLIDDIASPLVVTALLDPTTQRRFDEERRRLFPAGRTQVNAHVTLFHAVPGGRLDAVRDALEAERYGEPPSVRVAGVRSLGRGAAYVLDSPGLSAVRSRLAEAWWPWLTPQDRQPFRPHVTVQNKVDPATAGSTVAALTDAFVPHTTTCEGLGLWRYVGGPWEAEATFWFGTGGPSTRYSGQAPG